ncbi:MAG TPA: aminotransferase class I/II-fold pyridoxal phosphate-dependent enzyme [Clostridia bacterium]|nr:aminotransferase class I/II-fold pyridoxal phosphate-dependent enzyme [Clostridia bacterium]HPQ45837.1 aminotransferase class I/II-fold pyridoxal phosphate-dependent enzyme [Clostridia bacterium]
MTTPERFIKESIRSMPPSGIRKYFDLINELEGVISLGIGEPDFVTPWSIREAGIFALEQGHTHYSANAGIKELRKEIATYLDRKYKAHYNPDNEIIVTVGASEGIDLALSAILEPGDEVIVPEPSFVAYKGCVLTNGGTPVSLPLKEENLFKIDPGALERAITNKTKAVIIPFPNNPTGSVMTGPELEEIVRVLEKKDLLIISDEIYSELTYGFEFRSMATFPSIRDRLILVNGFSKSHAMTGWRLGYVCGDARFVKHMFKIHQYALMCAPTVAQYAGIEALRNCDDEVSDMVGEYDRRRKFLLKGVRDLGLKCFEPQGAFYIFPNITSTGMTSDEFCEGLLREEKVLVIPGTAFGDSGEGYVRATYASSMENIKEALERMERFLTRRKGN